MAYYTIQLGGKHIKLQIWDTNGCERFRSIRTSYYRGAQGFLLVYDVTDRNSFTDIDQWLTEIQRHCDDSNVNIILIGSKCDLTKRREVSTEEGSELAKKHNFRFFETSAAANINVEEPFMALAEDCYKRLSKVEEQLESPTHSPINKQSNSILSTFTRLFLPRKAVERERTSRESRERDAREREARQVKERSLRESKERSLREAEERSLRETIERSAREAEDRSTRERSAASIRERAAKAAEDRQRVERRKYGEASASPGGDVSRNSSNEASEEYKCPILFEVMNEPVICADGFSYERSAIEFWLRSHNTSPKTNLPLEHRNVIPNRNLKILIDEWKDKNR